MDANSHGADKRAAGLPSGPPTALARRDAFIGQVNAELSAAEKPLSFLLVHVANIKHIIHALGADGHRALTKEILHRLRPGLDDIASGDGGGENIRLAAGQVASDEIGILLCGAVASKMVEALAERMAGALTPPVPVAGHRVGLDAAVGVALSNSGDNAETLIRNASLALESARRRGGARFAVFTRNMATAATERLEVETRLRRALERDELFLRYQPQVSLSSGKVVGVEALVRWEHPERGPMLPGRFISDAEEWGLGLAIFDWVVRHACSHLKTWQETGRRLPRMSLNLTSDSIELDEAAERLSAILAETGVTPSALELEITERFVMDDPERNIAAFERLKTLGFDLVLDDFGTGYSSLTYLKDLPVSRLKIDRSFVVDLPANRQDVALVRGIVGLAHGLGLEAVAEGVERREQLECLAGMGCDIYQGFLFSRPLPAPDIANMLKW